jgi:SAM-dependent MidA family methyltransferase
MSPRWPCPPSAEARREAWLTWRDATQQALYAGNGFYRRPPASASFRTSVHASPRYAAALLRLLQAVDADLGRPARLDLADIGAGRGELLAQVAALARGDLARRLRLTAVEIAGRPGGLAGRIAWQHELPRAVTGLIVANEWLDNVPVDAVELTGGGPRLVLVDPATGRERLGGLPGAYDLAWLWRWWRLAGTGDRAEVGWPRDQAWAEVIRRLRGGLAVAADYAHERVARPAGGTLAGYAGGRAVRPVPDGSCDITAHVALDACAAAGERAGASATLLTTQRRALRSLGLRGERPAAGLARTDPLAYRARLVAASEEAELIDRSGLGGFGWLVQAAGPAPQALARLGAGDDAAGLRAQRDAAAEGRQVTADPASDGGF